ncbi:Imm7 family immunity protein [Vallitalea guaymasensis]|uniref:Imm7 family immunity protein n=1 Tax=Vallitalea guaymasensis TaxID=1185412 RepID=UPI0023528610|nr:Imm7 family immunity protein [Vallitalea guaymasensis]
MYEFHGWAVIRETPKVIDEENINDIAKMIEEYIHNLNWESGILKIFAVNGEYQFIVSGVSNHKTQESEELLGVYKYIAKIAPGSYGLLYVKDDEDTKGLDNEFIVYTLVRGNLSIQKDTFISPFIPIVEDECTD